MKTIHRLTTRMNIFIAFANQDREVRDKLLRQMNLIKDRQGWNIWSAKEIKAGEKWDAEIQQRLFDSEVVILLLSTDFFNSSYITKTELPEIVAKHKSGNCHIIPVIAHICHWKDTAFGEYAQLGDIQALPVGEYPIVSRGHWDNDAQPYFETVQGIRESIQTFQQKKRKKEEDTERSRQTEIAARERQTREQRESEQRSRDAQARYEREATERAENERLTQLRREQEQERRRQAQAAWQQAADAHTSPAYENYLARYPQGEYAREARFRIKELKQKTAKPLAWGRYAAIGGGLVMLLLAGWWGPKMFGDSGDNKEAMIPTHTPIHRSDMVLIKGGPFEMGDLFGDGEKDEKPQHSVTVKDFYMDKTEVALADFKAFVDASGYQTDAERGDGSYAWNGKEWKKNATVNWRYDETGQLRSTYHYPVVHVSWNDAVAYCNWLSQRDHLTPCYTIKDSTVTCQWEANGYRLPTEAKWEYAARSGGKKYKYAWGNGAFVGNTADETIKQKFPDWTIPKGYTDGYVFAAPVGTFQQGDLGLCDMSGNVWEWCWDWYGDYSASAQTAPTGPASGRYRVLRGGGWYSLAPDCRAADRGYYVPSARATYAGFRLVSISLQ